MRTTLSVALAVLCVPMVYGAEVEVEPGVLELKTNQVFIFKDGYATIAKTAKGRTDEHGNLATTNIPAAQLGTFWISGPVDMPIVVDAEIHKSKSVSEVERATQSIGEILNASIGAEVKLAVHNTAEPVSGTVKAVLGRSQTPSSTAIGPLHSSARPLAQLHLSSTDLLVLTTEDGWEAVYPITSIQSIISGKGLKYDHKQEQEESKEERRLVFRMGEGYANKDVEFQITYLTEGLRWIPTYVLEGDLDETNTLSMRGELINNAEDIDDAEVKLFVGVPNFRFKNMPSPIAIALTNHSRSSSVSGGDMMFSNAIQSQVVTMNPQGTVSQSSSILLPPIPTDAFAGGEGLGTQMQDLYSFDIGRISLPLFGRSIVPVWTESQKVDHFYTIDLRPSRGGEQSNTSVQLSSGSSSPQGPNRIVLNDVWHQLELKNNSTVPWTTGTLMIVENGVPIAQDLITYTGPGQAVLIPLTRAINVRAHYEESVSGIDPQGLVHRFRTYAKISKSGTVSLMNADRKDITLRVSLSTGGEATRVSDNGRLTLQEYRPGGWWGSAPAFNAQSQIVWNVPLSSGESKELDFDFFYYAQ